MNLRMHRIPTRLAAAALAAATFALLAVVSAGPAASRARPTARALAQSVNGSAGEVARTVRAHRLRLLDGREAGLATKPGEVVVVNFWATWCRPCQRELPALERLHREIAGRGGRVLAVSIDAERRNVERFVRARGLGLPVAWDGPDGLASRLDLEALPLTLVFDRTGAVTWASTRTDDEGLAETRDAVRKALAAPPAPELAGDDFGGTR